VENVIPYYEPFIAAQKRGRHLYWTNFNLPTDLNDRRFAISQAKDELKGLCEFHNYDFKQYNGTQSVVKMARNLVDYEAGKTILETALGIIRKKDEKQTSIFDYL
jgi:DNA (cytosine-5)-methyltransferase 1